ncbi:MAG: hypothetical protein N3A66_02735, partial [Planctomycetota bacterium]|nr:hypothetical protein [Planctomycetota bacterium]
MIELPTQIRVSDLTKTHREYNLDIIDDYQALYDGGHEFRRRIERFLPRRKIEESAERVNLDGASMYEERKRCAGYVNRAGGLIDWIIAAILRNPPVICLAEDVESVRAGGEPKNPNSYWWSLNHNADGLWTPLRTICARLLRSSMLHNRSYLAVSFPRDEARLADVESLYARFFALGAREVDDWQRDDSGRLLWVRVHTVEMVRENVYSQPTAERHYWTYIDSDAMHVYTAERQLNQYGEARPWRNEDMAVLVSAKAHEFGRLPIFEIRTERGQWVMERIADVAIQLF